VKTRGIWEANIRMDLMEIGWEGVDCIHPVQNRNQWKALVNAEMNRRVPQKTPAPGSIRGVEFLN